MSLRSTQNVYVGNYFRGRGQITPGTLNTQTITCWARVTKVQSAGNVMLATLADSANSLYYGIGLYPSTGAWALANGDSSSGYSASSETASNAWTFLAMTCTGYPGTGYLYIAKGGNSLTQIASSATTYGHTLYDIACMVSNNENPVGSVACVKAWGRVLTSTEIENERWTARPINTGKLLFSLPLRDSLATAVGMNGAPWVRSQNTGLANDIADRRGLDPSDMPPVTDLFPFMLGRSSRLLNVIASGGGFDLPGYWV